MWPAVLAALLTMGGQTQLPTAGVRGTVVDAKTGAPIADASVTLVEASLTTRSGQDGRFEFANIPPREYTLTVSTIGYIFVRRRVEVTLNAVADVTVPLAEGTGTYQETVTVSADAAARPTAVGVSSQMELGSAGLLELRGVAADDPMRAIQALPGVATGDDFQAEFSVRGSAFRHVGVVMDGTPTQLLMHTVRSTNDSGSIAMINSDILSRAGLLAGPHARPHGDWLGATLEFDVRDGSRDRLAARAAVSGTSASGVFEGPIGRSRRGSWLVSVRQSYVDWLIRRLEPDIDSTIGFTDAQAKLAYDLTSRQQIQFFAIAGTADYRDDETGFANGIHTATSRSAMASLAWRYAHPRAIVSQRASFLRSTYHNRGVVDQPLADGATDLLAWRADVTAPLARNWTIEGGLRGEWMDAAETLRVFTASSATSVRLRFQRTTTGNPFTGSGWAGATWRGATSGIAAGVRLTRRDTTGSAALPWVLAERSFGATTVRGSVGRSAQFIDPLRVSQTTGGLDMEQATGYDAGIEHRLGRGIRVQATGFYRKESDVMRRVGEERVDPVTGARIPESTFPLFATSLSGTSRGVDLLLMRQSPTGLSGWVGYSWAHTRYQDEDTGEAFDGDFDQRHTLNVVAQQRLSYRLAISGKLRIGSNMPIVGYFDGTPEALRLGAYRNQVRLPVYARLDVRANRTFTFDRSRLTLFVEVMNLLGRDNLGQSDGFVRATLEAVGYVERLLPRVPSAGLLFEF